MRSYLTGKQVMLYDRLAESGEGVIYKAGDGVLVKIYHDAGDSQRFAKLKSMLDRPPADPTLKTYQHLSIAWPQDIILHEDGRCAGFTMPYVQNASDLTHVYNPSYRLRFAPRFNWFYLHHAARNYASAVDALHRRGYVIGDIKPQNVLVSSNALITIVDADSFQVRDAETGHIYRCPVGSEGFTAPELLDRLQGQSFATLNRRKRHDRFGMAIIIYLLLFGRHPFSEGRFRGKGDPPGPDERIRAGLWGHAKNSAIVADPVTVPLSCIHPELAQAFRQCFDDGHRDPSLRPRASQWRDALDNALRDLTACEREPNHYYWRGYGRCLWCQRAQKLGLDIYAIEPPPKPPEPVVAATVAAPRPVRVPRPVAPAKKPAPSFGDNWRWIIPLLVTLRYIPSCLSSSTPTPSYNQTTTFTTRTDNSREPNVNVDKLLEQLNDRNSSEVRSLSETGRLKSLSLSNVQFLSSKQQENRHGYLETEYMGNLSSVNGVTRTSSLMIFKISIPENYDVTGRNTYVGFYNQVYRKDLGPQTEQMMRNLHEFTLDESWEKVKE